MSDKLIEVGTISYNERDVLGKGSNGTKIYKGTFEEKQVAVKFMPKNYLEFFNREKITLQETDIHPNVIRYYSTEELDGNIYLALEQCTCSLADFMLKQCECEEYNYIELDNKSKENKIKKQILHEAALGLSHLHGMDLIHRNISTQNILLLVEDKEFLAAKLSDFELAKSSDKELSNRIANSVADEQVKQKLKKLFDKAPETDVCNPNKMDDVYTLGSIYTVTCTSFDENDLVLVRALIAKMQEESPTYRITAKDITTDPFFKKLKKVDFCDEKIETAKDKC